MWVTCIIIFVLLLVAELVYFKAADRFNIIDKPNERSSHTTIGMPGDRSVASAYRNLLLWNQAAFDTLKRSEDLKKS